jgi:hypothetical protein
MGMKMERDMENPEKMTPIQRADAPRLSAYMGSRGTMIPIPNIEEKMEKKRTTKTFLFKGYRPFRPTNREEQLVNILDIYGDIKGEMPLAALSWYNCRG